MDVRENLQDLLSGMGAKLGIPQLALDQDGSCSLVFDGGTTVNLQADSAAGNLIVYAEVGRLGEDNKNGVYTSLLEANLFWKGTGGATLALEPRTRTILLQYQESLPGMDQVRFEQILDRFLNAAEHWTSQLAEMMKDATASGDAPSSNSEGSSGIRV